MPPAGIVTDTRTTDLVRGTHHLGCGGPIQSRIHRQGDISVTMVGRLSTPDISQLPSLDSVAPATGRQCTEVTGC